jgi:hypothetical protein
MPVSTLEKERLMLYAHLQFSEFSQQQYEYALGKHTAMALEKLTFGWETEAKGWRRSCQLRLSHEDVEQAHNAGVLAIAAVVGHHSKHLAVADLDGAWLRVARRHADDVVRLVPCLLPCAVGRERFT